MTSPTRSIPSGITSGVERELTSAVDRTGWTPQLQRAAMVLPRILAMAPADFEAHYSSLYSSLD